MQGKGGRLRDAEGIACPAERPAKEGRAGTEHHGWLLAGCTLAGTPVPGYVKPARRDQVSRKLTVRLNTGCSRECS